MQNTSLLQPEFLKPRYWGTWIIIGFARLTCWLPLRARWMAGKLLGLLVFRLAAGRRHVVRTNLALCFPELNDVQLADLVKQTFESSGISLLETAMAWFVPPSRYRHLVHIEGLEHLAGAREEGRGVILLGMHLATLDFCGAVLGTYEPFTVMYRYNKNRLLEAIMTRGRTRNFDAAIERDNVRDVVRALKAGAIVWYGPDQDYGRKHSIFAPFFGQQAASITATARIARMTGSPVVVLSHYRDLASSSYRVCLSEPLQDFPTGDDVSDCTRVNALVEEAVRKAPEQYWWLHRRFKTRPEGEARLY